MTLNFFQKCRKTERQKLNRLETLPQTSAGEVSLVPVPNACTADTLLHIPILKPSKLTNVGHHAPVAVHSRWVALIARCSITGSWW